MPGYLTGLAPVAGSADRYESSMERRGRQRFEAHYRVRPC
jgi:hypothetical protein